MIAFPPFLPLSDSLSLVATLDVVDALDAFEEDRRLLIAPHAFLIPGLISLNVFTLIISSQPGICHRISMHSTFFPLGRAVCNLERQALTYQVWDLHYTTLDQ